MYVEQISVFLENKAGRLAEVARILADVNVNIRALSLADTSDFGVLRLLVNNVAKARETLKNNGFTVRASRVVAAEVEDKPGGLLKLLDIFDESKINIEYMYAYANPTGGKAVMIFRFDPLDEGVSALEKMGVHVLNEEDLGSR